MATLRFKKKNFIGTQQFSAKLPEEQAAALGNRVAIPPPPTRGDDEPTLRDEQQVVRCEALMIRGIRHRRTLMALLDLDDPRQMDRYMARVLARWELVGANQDYGRARGESLQRLDLVESKLWDQIDEKKKPTTKTTVAVLKTVLQVQQQRADILGLTPKVIATIGKPDDGAIAFSREVASHERVSMLAARMMKLIEERSNVQVIDHAPPRSPD